MKLLVLLIFAAFASEQIENTAENYLTYGENSIVVKIEIDDNVKVNKKSKYIGVSYSKENSKWKVQRRSKKLVFNGYYDDENTAAYASDTLAKKLMKHGEQKLTLNFPDDHMEVYSEKSSTYIGVSYYKNQSKWTVQRWCKNENKKVFNGCYDNEETAAHASDTLARKLMDNGDQNYKLNFPDDYTEVYPEERRFTSKYIGVSYNKINSKWSAQRRNKYENKNVFNGYYDDEKTAAHASDTLGRKLMESGNQKLKLNFPDDHTDVYQENLKKKRKRPKDLEHPQNN